MPKKAILWSPEARADLRSIDRETALRVLHAVDSYLSTSSGDVKKLKPPRYEFRLRVGDLPHPLSAKRRTNHRSSPRASRQGRLPL